MHFIEFVIGTPYFNAKKLIKQTEYYSKEQHDQLQRGKISQILATALQVIPFYKNDLSYLSNEISPETAIEILDRFPYISKSIIRENIDLLWNKNKKIRALKVATGGSSASPMPFYMDRLTTRQIEKAFMWNQYSRVGYRPGDSMASFTGNIPKAGKVFKRDIFFNRYIFSSFHLIPEKIDGIVSALNTIKPKFLHGYPSTLSSLAKIIKKSTKKLSFVPQAVLSGSEKTYPHQRQIMEEVFNTKIFTWYGHSEYSVLGGECECSPYFHLYPQYGYVEFLPVDAYHESGKRLYEIVATGFNNQIMPFIRYRTADYAIISDTPCPCGRGYPLIEEVVGRAQEFLVDRDDNLISVTALTSLFEKSPFIDDLSIFQDRPGKFILLILPSYEPSKKEINEINALIQTATDSRLTSTMQFVDEIPKAPSGKRCLVDQHLDIESYLNN